MNAILSAAARRAEDRRNAERRLVERRMSPDRRNADRREAEVEASNVTPIRHLHRTRDFGVGYGNSSGYASHARYTSSWNQPHFRVA